MLLPLRRLWLRPRNGFDFDAGRRVGDSGAATAATAAAAAVHSLFEVQVGVDQLVLLPAIACLPWRRRVEWSHGRRQQRLAHLLVRLAPLAGAAGQSCGREESESSRVVRVAAAESLG